MTGNLILSPPVAANARIRMTPEGGLAIRLINKTGAPSVKGALVRAGSSVDQSFTLQANEYDACGFVYESGIPDGALCWVVYSGIAEALLEDGTGAARGNWCHAASSDGRADCSLAQPSGAGFTEADEHFKEIGHCLETKSAGTNVLAKIIIHFL